MARSIQTWRRRVVFILLALIAAISALLWARLGNDSNVGTGAQQGMAIPVIVANVVRSDMSIWLDGIGTVQAINQVTISSRITGELMELGFREGGDVVQGDIIARIDSRTLQAEYDQAVATRDQNRAQLDIARLDLKRYQALNDRVSGQTLDTQRAKVKELEAAMSYAEAAIEAARTQLSYASIAAPLSGRAGLRRIDVGNIVQANDANGIVVITQVQPINVLFTLSQQSLPAILAAMKSKDELQVLLTDSANGDIIGEGILETIDNQIDPSTGSIRLKAIFANEERQLWPGGFVAVRLRVAIRKDGLIIPLPAIQRGPNGSFVYVVGADDKALMVPVKVAAIEDGMALLEQGPKEGDKIVIDGMARLAPGLTVSITERSKESPSP